MTPSDLLKEYETQLSHQDFEKVKPLIAEDAVFWFNDGSFDGLAKIEGAFKKTFDLIKDEKYWLSDLEWIVEGEDSAVCTYQFNWEGIIHGKESAGFGRGTSVLRKIGSNWKIIHEHLSQKPKQ